MRANVITCVRFVLGFAFLFTNAFTTPTPVHASISEAPLVLAPAKSAPNDAEEAASPTIQQPAPDTNRTTTDERVGHAQPSVSESPVVASVIAPTQMVSASDMGDLVAPTLPPADVVLVLPSSDQPVSQAQPRLQPQTQLGQTPLLSESTITFYSPGTINDEAGGGESSPSTLSPLNVAFKLNFDTPALQALTPDAKTAKEFTLGVDYSAIAIPYGGDFVERMALYEGFNCTFDAAGHLVDCATLTPLHGYHDYARHQLVATIDTTTLNRWTSDTPKAANDGPTFAYHAYLPAVATTSDADVDGDAEVPSAPNGPGGVIILSAGTDSPTGDYGATPVGDVLDYQVGLFSGSAQTSYPIPVPAAAAGPAPDVSLNYDSASVDGTSISRSAQPGSVGLGWTQKTGAIVRLMRTAPSGTGNLCWTTSGADFVFSLNGVSSRLVKISATDYVLSDDTRWKLQFLTSSASQHPDYDKKYWLVTAPDGTQYRFGGEIEPETNADQNSVFWVPSFVNATSSSCNTGSGGLQNRAWQWNLDRVEDTNGNVVSYFYEQERNYYKAWIYQSGTYQHKQYIRAGHVQRIEYTKRSGTTVQPQARVLFHTEMRCENPTTTAGCDTTGDYPDTPSDLQCGASGCTKISPTFWTYRRLQAIQTQTYNPQTGRWTTAGLYELAHSFPVPPIDANGFTSTQKLWLDSIVRRPGGDWAISPYSQIEAERYDQMNGVTITDTDDLGSGQHAQALQANDWLRFNGVNFGDGAALLLARAWSSAAMSVEVRLDDSAAAPTVRLAVPNLSSAWKTLSVTLPSITGVHDVYLYITGSGVDKLKLNWFRFNRATQPTEDIPAVTFGGVMLANRSNPYATLRYQYMPRIMTMTNELGGVTAFTYGRTHTVTTGLNCGTSSMDDTVARPPLDCFRAYYTSDFAGQGSITFAKYKVLNARSYDLFSGNPAVVYTYTYSAPTYAYYDDPTSDRKYWDDFRGHEVVTATDASGVMTEHRFYRGLNGDRLNSSSSTLTYTARITLSDGSTRPDYAWLRGKEVETRVLKANGSPLSRAVTVYTWTLTAGAGVTGAYFVGTQIVTGTAYGTITKTTQSDMTYDAYGNAVLEVHRGDISTLADDRTVERSFVYNTTAYIVNRAQWEKLWAGTASGASGNEKSYRTYGYDGAAVGVAPAKGNQTLARAYSQVAPAAVYADVTTGYDGYGRPITATDANGHTTHTEYDSFYGYARVITNALNQAMTTLNDPRWGVPLVITDANGGVTTQQYDGYGRRMQVWLPAEPAGGAANYQYTYAVDARPAYVQSRQLMQRDAGTYLESWTYYDGLGREIQTQQPDPSAGSGQAGYTRILVSKGYDALGQALYTSAPYSATGAAGSGYVTPTWTDLVNYTYLGYDELGNQTRSENRSYTTTLWSTSSIFDVWQQRHYDAKGHYTDQEYDASGKLVAVTEYNTAGGPSGITNTTRYAYDLQGNLALVTDALTHTTVITYDLLGRKTAMADPDMGAWAYGYDAAGNLITQTDALARTLVMQYDALNRLTQKQATAGSANMTYEAEASNYHQVGAISTTLGAWVSQGSGPLYLSYGPYQPPLEVGPGQKAVFRLAIDNANGSDAVGWIDVTTNSGMQWLAMRTLYRNEFAGGLSNFRDFELAFDTTAYEGRPLEYRVYWYGNTTMAHDRTSVVWQHSGALATYGYDSTSGGSYGVGRRTSMANAGATTTWVYDMRGRVVNEGVLISGAGVYTTSYTYDDADHVVSVTYPGGEVVSTGYDALAQPITLTGQNNYVTGASYNILGQPQTIVAGNGRKTAFQYFGLDASVVAWAGRQSYGQLRRICVLPAASTTDCEADTGAVPTDPLLNVAVNYDVAGNVTVYRDATPNKQQKLKFNYDSLNRLVGASPDPGGVPNWTSVISYFTESYAYDAVGDLLTHTTEVSGSAASTFALGYTSSKPHAATTVNEEQHYWYDANGNMTTRVEVSGTQFITYAQGWDIDNRLIAVTDSAGQLTKYTYDADGNRVLRTNPDGTKVAYVSDRYEVQVSTGLTTSYYFFGSQRVAMRQGDTLTYLYADYLGSASLATDASGDAVSEMRYFPFGQVRFISGTMPTDRTFTGQRTENLDAVGSLMDYGARYYSPLLGRFISADSVVPQPADPQSLNRYSYALNSPLVRVDPSGHGDCPVLSAAFCQPGWYGLQNNPYHIRFEGSWKTLKMGMSRAWSILRAAELTESKLRQKYKRLPQKGEGTAWHAVYGSVTIYTQNDRSYGYGPTAHTMYFGNGALDPPGDTPGQARNFLFNTIHEFGHLFAHNAGDRPYQQFNPDEMLKRNGQPVGLGEGFKGGNRLPYRQHTDARGNEEFADMYLNWVLGSFTNLEEEDKYTTGAGNARQTWMDNHIEAWTALAVSNNEPKPK